MQLQKNLRESIRKCHERRLQKICSMKKKLGSYNKTPNLQSNKDFRILAEIHNSTQIQEKDLFLRKASYQNRSKIYQLEAQNIDEELMTEINSNKQQLQNAKRAIAVLEKHMNEIEQEIIDKQQTNNKLLELNNNYYETIEDLKSQLEQKQAKIIEKENQILEAKIRIDEYTRDLDQNIVFIQNLSTRSKCLEEQSSQARTQLNLKFQMLLEQKNSMHKKLTQFQHSTASEIQNLKSQISQFLQNLSQKSKSYTRLETQHLNLRTHYQTVYLQNSNYKCKIQLMDNQKAIRQSQLQQFITLNNKYQQKISQQQLVIAKLEQTIKYYQKQKQVKSINKQQLQRRWQSMVPTQVPIKAGEYCCEHELKEKYIQLLFELISTSQPALELLLAFQPNLHHSMKIILDKNNIKNNPSGFSLSSSFHRIIGSYQQIAKMSQNDISNFIQQHQNQNDNSSPQAQEEINQNQQQLLARMEEQVQNMSSSHGVNQTDLSELKQNYNAIKTVNQQLFYQVSNKQQEIKRISERLKFYENYSGMIQHLKSNFGNLAKELKSPNQKVAGMLQNIRSLLGK